MRSFVLRAERKFFPSFNLKFSPKAALPFAAECLLLFLFASVDKFGFALALGLFCGLVYARQNIFLIAPSYILACFVFVLDWKMLLFALAPVLVLVAVYAVFYKLKRNVPVWAVALGALVGMIPYAVCGVVFDGDYLTIGLSLTLAAAGVFCNSIVAYATLIRRFSGSATIDELMCLGLLAVACGYALCNVGVYGFFLLPFVVALGVVVLSACFKSGVAMFFALLLGVGAAIRSGSFGFVGWAAILGGVAVAFSPFTRLPSSFAVVCAEAFFWLFGAYRYAGWESLVMASAGVIAALCVPRTYIKKVESTFSHDSRRTYSSIVNRRGKEMANRLYHASDVFFDMSKTLEKIATDKNEYTPKRLAHEIAKNYCGKCEDCAGCFSALGEDTACMLEPMTTAALARGKTSILDMPTFITSHCTKVRSLASVINSSAEAYKKREEEQDGIASEKMILSEQFAGVALVFDSLAAELGAPVSFATEETQTIKSELLRHNVVASDVVVTGNDDDISVALIVRAQDAEKQVIAKTVSKLLGTRLEVAKIGDRGSEKSLYLESAPAYEVAYGIAERIRSGEDVSGDSRTVQNVSRTSRLFAICDGMGSGEKAREASLDAVNLVESFYRAGLPNEIVLSLVNRLLKISLDDNFSSLDISVIDVKSGGLDVIKLGSASSFILRGDSVEQIACSSPPAGIVDVPSPTTLRFQLYDGNMVILMSDGVFDALDAQGVVDVIDATATKNPQTLANALLKRAVECGAEDDCTVLVMKLFAT